MAKSIDYISKKASLTIEIEKLSLPPELLPEIKLNELVSKYGKDVKAVSSLPSELVNFGGHSFLGGMYQAYSDHRPFTISPEMIWLLIQQGISIHLYHNVGKVVKYYPELIEKKELKIERNGTIDQLSDWRDVISFFVDQMGSYLSAEFIDNFKLNFSNSTTDEIIAGDLMMMDAMQPYFKYLVNVFICGIPNIELEGSANDWDKILLKINYFRKLDLDWWFDKIEPIINKIKEAFSGKIDRSFWMNMFKVHTREDYGNPKVIDGWITQFYPYDKKGNRILDNEMSGLSVESIFESLPKELRTIPFQLQLTNFEGQLLKEYSMEFTAGFVGLSQYKKTMRLRPEIGWFVGHKTEKSPKDLPYEGYKENSREYYSLDSFPMELLDGSKFEELILNFKNEIKYPTEIATINTKLLMLNGKVELGILEDLQERFRESSTRVILNYDWDGIYKD
ncbi:MAG: DUF4419 domain-containing protein [Bacteroidota bacterium]